MKLKRRFLSTLILFTMTLGLTNCGSISNEQNLANTSETTTVDSKTEENKKTAGIKITVTVGKKVLTATLIDNSTTRSLISKFPLTVPMANLYSREMCYRFPDELPTDNVQTAGYEVGEIVYWPPRHSFVILYAQNGERFDMQKLGRIDSGVETFKKTEDVDVKFECHFQ
jgi:hypothetical protein